MSAIGHEKMIQEIEDALGPAGTLLLLLQHLERVHADEQDKHNRMVGALEIAEIRGALARIERP